MTFVATLRARYEAYKAQNLSLDLTRGKPSSEQLDLSMGLLDALQKSDLEEWYSKGLDLRNYGPANYLMGLPEARALFQSIFSLPMDQILCFGNSSLTLMYDAVEKCCKDLWVNVEFPIKFLCPVPGYDRHFNICEAFGIEMISVPMTGRGPDMDVVESLLLNDSSIKGIWCVPKYSNPTGETYDDVVLSRLASMKASPDFRIFWDNAYAMHDFDVVSSNAGGQDYLGDIYAYAQRNCTEDRILMFSSFSKITFAGSAIAAMGMSPNNMNYFLKKLSMQSIGSDKLNQVRHINFFKHFTNIKQHMQAHANLLKPRFDRMDEILKQELGVDGVYAHWSSPKGGYFISLNTQPYQAKKVIALAKNIGVNLTPAGSAFPYGKDPLDQNIRLAPSYPSLEEVSLATEVLCVIIKLVYHEGDLK